MGLFGRTGGSGRHAKGGKNYRPQAVSRGRKKAAQYGPLGNPFPTPTRSRFNNSIAPTKRLPKVNLSLSALANRTWFGR